MKAWWLLRANADVLDPASPWDFQTTSSPPLRSRDILESFPKGVCKLFVSCCWQIRAAACSAHALTCFRLGMLCQDAFDFGHLPLDTLTWMWCLEALSTFPLESKLLMASAAAAQIIIQSWQLECGYFFNDVPCLGCATGSLLMPCRSHSGDSAI